VKPEALALEYAYELESIFGHREAAAELRRLHEVNQEMLEELKDAAEAFEVASEGGGINFHLYAEDARAAIAKATGEKK
jgi:hypothetical protein